MKTAIVFTLILFCSTVLFAQITVTGSTTTSANTTYNIGTINDSQVSNSDAGTTIYRDVPWYLNVPIPFTQHRIYRVNGVWQLDKVFIGANGPGITLLHTMPGNSANPPCEWTNGVMLTGTCQQATVQATTITPSYISVPQLSATAISAIPTPQRGMLVFDTTNSCLKLYNGTAWKCLVAQ